MPMGSWVVSSVIRFSSNGVAELNKIAGATNRVQIGMDRLTGKISAQTAAYKRLSLAAEEAAMKQSKLLTNISLGVAAAGGAAIYEGLKQAGELQRSMTAVNIATMNQAPQAMRRMVMQVSGMTAQSATTIADELATVASSGMNRPKQLQSVFPLFAQAADVAYLGPKHLDPIETVKQLAQFSHQFGIYGGKPLRDMVDSAIRLQSLQPEGLQAMITQGRLFVGQAMARGVPMDEIFRQYMLMGQTGQLRGRGGSGVENVMEYLQGAESLTNHMSKVRRAAFLDLDRAGRGTKLGGMFDADGRLRFVDKDGNLHLEAAEKYLAELAPYMTKGQFSNDLLNAFGKQGSNYLTVATRPAVQHQFEQNEQVWKKIPGVSAQWAEYMKNFPSQVSRAATNFKNIVIDVFTPMLPRWTSFMKGLADGLGNIGDFLTAHPGVAGTIGNSLVMLTGIAAVIGSVGLVTQGLLFLGVIKTLPNAFMLCVGPVRWMITGLWGIATSGQAAGVGSWAAAGGLRAAATAAWAFAAPLAVLAGIMLGTTSFTGGQDTPDSAGWSKGYREYLRKRHIGTDDPSPYKIEPGDLTPGQYAAKYGNPRRGLKGAHATAGVHIDKVAFEITGVTDPKQVAAIVDAKLKKLFKNPRSVMSTNSPTVRTHPGVPLPLSTQPGFG